MFFNANKLTYSSGPINPEILMNREQVLCAHLSRGEKFDILVRHGVFNITIPEARLLVVQLKKGDKDRNKIRFARLMWTLESPPSLGFKRQDWYKGPIEKLEGQGREGIFIGDFHCALKDAFPDQYCKYIFVNSSRDNL